MQPFAIVLDKSPHFFGEEVQRIQRGRQELKVMVRYPSDERRSMQDLYNARIRLADGTETSLRTVATLTESRGYSSIDRVDGARIVLVSAQIDTAMATPTEVNDVLKQEVLPALQEEYRGLKFKQAGRSQAQAEDMASLGSLALVALLVIYVMIASQLRSYAQPLVIMSAVPFGAGGALIGHFVLGFDLSFVSVFGKEDCRFSNHVLFPEDRGEVDLPAVVTLDPSSPRL